MQENDIKSELSNLLNTFSQLSKDEQVKEIEEKVKSLIAIFNGLNNNKELLLVPHGDNLTQVYSLLCCLEEEVAKLLTNDIN